MRKSPAHKLMLLTVLLMLCGNKLAAQDNPFRTEYFKLPIASTASDRLSGLRGFEVSIQFTSKTADTTDFRNRVELKLRQNRIRVDSSEIVDLVLQCNVLDDDQPAIVVFSCSLDVRQPVARATPTPLRMTATVWQGTGVIGSVGSSKFQDSIQRVVDKLLDEFLNDWYKANPA